MELLSFCGTLTLGLSSDMKTIVKDFESFGPTLLLAVPRVFEKVYNAASQRAGKGIAGKMFLRAADVARDWSKAEQAGEKLPWRGRLAHGFYELVVYKKIRTIFGPTPTSPSPAAPRWTPTFRTSSTASACRCLRATA